MHHLHPARPYPLAQPTIPEGESPTSAAHTVTARPTPTTVAGWTTPLISVKNNGATTVYVGQDGVTVGSGTAVAAGATVEYVPATSGSVQVVAASNTQVEVTRFTSRKDIGEYHRGVVSAATGVPVHLITGRT